MMKIMKIECKKTKTKKNCVENSKTYDEKKYRPNAPKLTSYFLLDCRLEKKPFWCITILPVYEFYI